MPKLIMKLVRDTGGLASVGIIGGSDGPTAVYISGINSAVVLPFTAVSAAAVIAALGICVFLHIKKK